MTQYAIVRLRDGPELVCRLQTDLGVETPYTLCAPVVARSDWGTLVPRLHIPAQIEGRTFVILMTQMVALPTVQLGERVGDASPWRDDIISAINLLVSGF